jgi:hypothetical protein
MTGKFPHTARDHRQCSRVASTRFHLELQSDILITMRRVPYGAHALGSAMRRLVAISVVLSTARLELAQVSRQPTVPQSRVEVEIELLEDLSSETLHAGQSIAFKLVRPLDVDGRALLSAGAPVTGKVIKVQTAGNWKRNGAFDLTLDPLQLADGRLAPIEFHHPSHKNGTGEKISAGVLNGFVMSYYFPLIPLALIQAAPKGKPFRIRAGERYLVYAAIPQLTEMRDP